MNKPKIQVIIGSTRPGRMSEKVAKWFKTVTAKRTDFEFEYIDLRDWELPFFDQAKPPSLGGYEGAMQQRWADKVAEADGYVMVTPEYNHGYPAVLKNAIDHVYAEWNNKPVGFVSWGSANGARGIEQLRLVAVELQMAPIRAAVMVPDVFGAFDDKDDLIEPQAITKTANGMLDQLSWWTGALKTARAAS